MFMTYEIRARTEAYLRGDLTLEDVTSWLLGSLQTILDSNDTVAISLANRLDALLVEREDERIDQQSFLDALRELAAGQVTVPQEYREVEPVASFSETSSAVWPVREAVTLDSSPVRDLRLTLAAS